MPVNAEEYATAALELCELAIRAELPGIRAAAVRIADAIEAGHRWWAFGAGHSHLIAEELWGRAGGIAEVHAILEPSLMLHEGFAKSSAMERLPGLAAVLADVHGIAAGDVLLVVSNSGRNAAPVELAEIARERGLTVIALTSVNHGSAVTSRAPSGRRLVEIADIVLDNHGPRGDALLEREGGAVGATSTVVGALIVQCLAAEVVGVLDGRGVAIEVYRSQNA